MRKVLVITNDESWRQQFLKEGTKGDAQLSFVRDLRAKGIRDRISENDWIVLDATLLPRPESTGTNSIRELLRGKSIVAVYTPGTPVGLSQYRSSSIVGACGLVKKPYTGGEIALFFEHSELEQQYAEMRRSWRPTIMHR